MKNSDSEFCFDYSKYNFDSELVTILKGVFKAPKVQMELSLSTANQMEELLDEIRYKLSDEMQEKIYYSYKKVFEGYGILEDTIRRFTKEHTFFMHKYGILKQLDDLQEEYGI